LLLALAALPLTRPRVAAAAAQTFDVPAGATDWARAGIERFEGTLARVFGLDTSLAAEVLLPATRLDALPDGYAPSDLVWASAHGIPGNQLIRAIIVEDTRNMVRAAAAEGHRLVVASGYRSQSYQVQVFAAQAARWGDDEIANRYSARAGHSQHQLGTTIDFTDSFRAFRESGTPAWLEEHAYTYGFVFPYTTASQERTGYVAEPWHGRWVGAALATHLQQLDYLHRLDLTADDAIAIVRAEAGLSTVGI
jgi:zinc D-Ala-D-Ala carboxypeptidase